MTEVLPWLALVALGMFHGVNPGMGWLFAVALGLHRQSRRVVLLSLIPIALGHAVAIGVVAALVTMLGVAIPEQPIRQTAGVVLIAWAVYHYLRGHRHRVRVGMQTGMWGLAGWSFLMATAHGAGLMLIPALMPLTRQTAHADMGMAGHGESLAIALGAVLVHSGAMIVTTGLIAVAVYQWLGIGFLRRGWINLDLLWTIALVITGLLLLLA